MAPSLQVITTAVSSTLLRVFAYIFLRWVPGHHFPSLILALSAIYWPTFLKTFMTTSPWHVISDEIDIITRETVNQDDESEDEVSEDEVSEDEVPEDEKLVELDVTEKVKLEPKSPEFLKSLLFGLPSPVSLGLTLLTSGINLALLLMALDMVYRAPVLHQEHDLSFSRVGFVSFDSAKILVREPRIRELPLFLSYRYAGPPARGDPTWKHAARINDLNADSDYTTTASLTHLSPDTRYQYAWSNNQTGFLTTSPGPGLSPSTRDGTFTFLFSSCIKPRVPYSPLDHPLHVKGLAHLAKWIPELKAQFMVFMGDFIYIDVPQRFGTDMEAYRAEYRRTYASPEWPAATAELPWIHVIDDHEIANDWDKNTTGIYEAAADPFMHYHVSANPPPVKEGETYFRFTQGPLSMFMLESRRYRTAATDDPTSPEKSMLGHEQLAHFLEWIREPAPKGVKWKVVVSSVPFTKNWRFGSQDTWGGYLYERRIILETMWHASLEQGVGMVVISGDRHEAAVTQLRDETGRVPGEVTEFSVSPLNMFYLPKRTYKQEDEEDVMIKYLPDGNSKFGALEFSNVPHSAQSLLHFRLFVDGEETYSHTVTSPAR